MPESPYGAGQYMLRVSPVLRMGRRTDHNGVWMGRIDFNVLEIGNEFSGNEETLRAFLYLGHDHVPFLQCDDEYVLLPTFKGQWP